MAIIQKIRNRSGLMLLVIGGCLVLFILSDALSRRGGFSSDSDPNTLGEVNGTEISREEYNQFVSNMESRYQQQGQMINDYTKQQINEQAWNSLVDLAIREDEYKAAGISSSDEEVATMFFQYYTNNFAQALGVPADVEKVREAIKNTEDKEVLAQVATLEKDIRRNLNYMKYQRLIQAGFIATQAEAKYQYEMNTITNEFVAGVLPYSSIVDSTVKVTEEELKDAYNKEKDSYKQKEGRDLRFAVFPLEPSIADEQKVTNELLAIKARFASYKGNDANFVNTESDGAAGYQNTFYTKGAGLPMIMDSSFAALSEGQIFGPYLEYNSEGKKVLKVAKVLKVKLLADSVHVRHILISVKGARDVPGSENFHLTSQERMVAVTDSLEKILKTKPEMFDVMVQQHSDDFMSIGKGGDIGWISKNSAYATLFDSCMLANEGSIIKVFSNKDGMHLVKILQQGNRVKKVNPGIIARELRPSKETLNQLYVNANEVSDLLKGGKKLDTLVSQRQLRSGMHAMLSKNDIAVNGLEGAREVVKWAYNANVADVSSVIQLTESYVVVLLEKEYKDGVKAFEDVKKEIEMKLITEKKAAQLTEKLKSAILAGAGSFSTLKSKYADFMIDSVAATPVGGNMPKFGNEPDVMGMVAAVPVNKMSSPITGKMGVYVVLVSKRAGNEVAIKDFSPEQNDIAQKTKAVVDQFLGDALKANVDIEDNRFEKLD